VRSLETVSGRGYAVVRVPLPNFHDRARERSRLQVQAGVSRGRRVATMDRKGEQDEEMNLLMEKESEEYRKLKLQHREYEEKLNLLAAKRALTEEEKLEEVRIKKEKLFVKDRMAAIRREFTASRQS
jgi:hypothetical protein